MIQPLHIPCRQCFADPGAECRWPQPKGDDTVKPRFHRIREDHAAKGSQLAAVAT